MCVAHNWYWHKLGYSMSTVVVQQAYCSGVLQCDVCVANTHQPMNVIDVQSVSREVCIVGAGSR